MQDRSTSDLLDIREAAAFLRVSETSLRRWTNAGRLPCLRIGGRRERRLVAAEYHASGAEQLEYWRARMRAALTSGVTAVYVVGDLSAGFKRLPFAATLAYEAEYGRSIAQAFPVTTLCQYDARKISGLDAAGLLQCHDGPLH